jgi:hypothetical protein
MINNFFGATTTTIFGEPTTGANTFPQTSDQSITMAEELSIPLCCFRRCRHQKPIVGMLSNLSLKLTSPSFCQVNSPSLLGCPVTEQDIF